MSEFNPAELAQWTNGEWLNGVPLAISRIVHDSRSIQPRTDQPVRSGDLYVALRGDRHDGHAFVQEAMRRGAVAALVERMSPVDVSDEFPLLCVDHARRALMDLARGHRKRLRGKLIGITGSVGKTSVKEMTADVLTRLGRTARSLGNWNNDIGLPLSLLSMEPHDAFGVFEIGMNHPGEMAPLCDVLKPSWGIMTPVGSVHAEFFPSVQAIVREKAELLKSLNEHGVAVLCKDDPWYDDFRNEAHGRVVTVSLRSEADYRGEPDGPGRMQVYERGERDGHVYHLPVPGEYTMSNALRAIAVGREHGLAHGDLAETIRQYRPLPMRWTRMETDGRILINDAYNSNPLSMRVALDAFAEMPAEGRKWLVLGGMLELGDLEEPAHLEAGRELVRGPWAGLITVGALGKWIADGAEQEGFAGPIHRCEHADEAARTLAECVRAGDAVLLKASRAERLEEVVERLPEYT